MMTLGRIIVVLNDIIQLSVVNKLILLIIASNRPKIGDHYTFKLLSSVIITSDLYQRLKRFVTARHIVKSKHSFINYRFRSHLPFTLQHNLLHVQISCCF